MSLWKIILNHSHILRALKHIKKNYKSSVRHVSFTNHPEIRDGINEKTFRDRGYRIMWNNL